MAKIQPKTVEPAVQSVDHGLPRCRHVKPNAKFTLVHHHSWTFTQDSKVEGYEDGRWLPDTGTIRHEPGANGVTKNGDPKAAILGQISKGSIPILLGDNRLGKYSKYLAAFDIKGGGKLYVLAGVRYALIKGGRAAIPVPDKSWIYNFRENLYECGIVPAMTAELLGDKIHTRRARLQLYASQAANGTISEEAYQRKLRESSDEIEAWEDAWQRQFGEELEEPGELIGGGEVIVDPTLTIDEPKPKAKAPTARKTIAKRVSK
jgi:hypothetical protein